MRYDAKRRQATSPPILPLPRTRLATTSAARRAETGTLRYPQALPGDDDQSTAIDAWDCLRLLAWDRLPEAVRESILMLVKAAAGG